RDRRLVVGLAAEVDRGAVGARRLDLRDRGPGGHADGGGDAQQLGSEADALGVVAGAGRDDATQPLVGAGGRDPVEAAADLERARAWEVLGLQVDVRAGAAAEVARREDRRPHRDLVDDPGRAPDVVDGDHADRRASSNATPNSSPTAASGSTWRASSRAT